MFFALFGYWLRGAGFPEGLVHNLMCSFSPWTAKKSKFLKLTFDIVITQNDHPRYVKHVVGRVYVCFTLFGYWACAGGGMGGGGGGGAPEGLAHNLQMQFFTQGGSKPKFWKLIFLIL